MTSFFKTIGKGLLYLMVLPLIIVSLAIMTLITLAGLPIFLVISFVLLLKKKSVFGLLEEDKEAKRRLDLKKGVKEEEKIPLAPLKPNQDNTPVIEAPITQTYVKEEEILSNPTIDDKSINPNQDNIEKEEDIKEDNFVPSFLPEPEQEENVSLENTGQNKINDKETDTTSIQIGQTSTSVMKNENDYLKDDDISIKEEFIENHYEGSELESIEKTPSNENQIPIKEETIMMTSTKTSKNEFLIEDDDCFEDEEEDNGVKIVYDDQE